jgi:menaquinone-9 beta-reductase
MPRSPDPIVIIGAGPAGLVAAISAVRRAPEMRAQLLVVEAKVHPREKICAGAVGGRGQHILSVLGALPAVAEVPIRQASLQTKRARLISPELPLGSVVRRAEFDFALLKISRGLGIKVTEACIVRTIVQTPDCAILETSQGLMRARVVVGADGVGSLVRRALAESSAARDAGSPRGTFRMPGSAQVLEVDTEACAEDGAHRIHFDLSDSSFPGYFWDFPTLVEGTHMMCRGVYALKRPNTENDLEALLAVYLARRGLDLAHYRKKRFAERGFPLASALSAGRLMLIGEAAGIDPVTGEGIAQAIEYGDLAGAYLATEQPIPMWNAHLRASRLGRDLWLRSRALSAFYGSWRGRSIRALEEHPRLIEAAARHFAGARQSLHRPWELARTSAALGRSLAFGLGGLVR